jgi:carboxyl-terminal processing protease
MRPFVFETANERIEAGLLLEDIGCGALRRRLLERDVHPLVTHVLLLHGAPEKRINDNGDADDSWAEREAAAYRVPDKVVNASKLPDGTRLIRVSMFPGVLGMDVAPDISRAVADLKCGSPRDRSPWNSSGDIGCLRLMSHLRADRRGVGYSVSRDVARKDSRASSCPRSIASLRRNSEIVPLMFRFARVRRSVAVITEALGDQPHRSRVAMFVNEHSASATEMVAAFASEYSLATLVGVKTAGRLVATSAFKVGMGYGLVLRVAAYYIWNRTNWNAAALSPTLRSRSRPTDC